MFVAFLGVIIVILRIIFRMCRKRHEMLDEEDDVAKQYEATSPESTPPGTADKLQDCEKGNLLAPIQ